MELAFDPQTSGGLLVAIPASDAQRAIESLENAKTPALAQVGRVAVRGEAWVELA